jgi:hypothetical protein
MSNSFDSVNGSVKSDAATGQAPIPNPLVVDLYSCAVVQRRLAFRGVGDFVRPATQH